MKKYLLLGSLATMLLITGCQTTQGGAGNTTETAGTDGTAGQYNSVEEKVMAIEQQLQTIYFDYDKFNIRSDMVDAVNSNSELLKATVADLAAGIAPEAAANAANVSLRIRVEGNTDEWGTDEYNQALGNKRAVSVRDALVGNGFTRDVIEHVTYGETNPVCSEKTDDCWSKNRRVDFKLVLEPK